MTIGEVAAQAGLATSAIRYYEKQGLLDEPPRTNGRRIYSSEILHRLVIIGFAKRLGFTLPEIHLLLHGFPARTTASVRWRKLAGRKIKEMEETIAKAGEMKRMLESILLCRCKKLEQCARGLARHQEKFRNSGRRCGPC